MPQKRRVGRPRKRLATARRRVKRVKARRFTNQPGGQFGALLPIAKILGPILLGEAAKIGIGELTKSIKRKRRKGRGLGVAGSGLRLAGAGHRRRKPGPKKRRRPPSRIPPGFKFPILLR